MTGTTDRPPRDTVDPRDPDKNRATTIAGLSNVNGLLRGARVVGRV
jgi:hypothetical protein